MLKLINISSYNGSSKVDAQTMTSRIISSINNNSSVFNAESISGYNFKITSENVTISTGFNGTGSTMHPDCGYTLAIDDEKEFLLIIPKNVCNTQGNPVTNDTGYNYGSQVSMSLVCLCITSKDINGHNRSVYSATNQKIYGGLTFFFDIGQKSASEFYTEGDFILRQGAIRNHIVPELFFSMTRLGSCGDIIEKDGHQYTCIAGPIFYQIS